MHLKYINNIRTIIIYLDNGNYARRKFEFEKINQ